MRASAAASSRLHALLDVAEDAKLIGPLAVKAALSKCLSTTSQDSAGSDGTITGWQEKPYDFNRDANLTEALRVIPVLESLTKRCDVLLEEWPDHATLKQVPICFILSIFFLEKLASVMKCRDQLGLWIRRCEKVQSFFSIHLVTILV
jgi:hypothetical protein